MIDYFLRIKIYCIPFKPELLFLSGNYYKFVAIYSFFILN